MLSALSWLSSTAASWLGFGRAQAALPVPDEINRLPLELQYAICQRLGLVDLVTLTSDRPALRELTHTMVDRAAHDFLLRRERGEEEWPAERKTLRKFVASHCSADGQEFPHTRTLLKLLDATAGLSSGATASAQLTLKTLPDVSPIGRTLVLPHTGVAELAVLPDESSANAGTFLQSLDGTLRQPDALVGRRIVPASHCCNMTDAFLSCQRDALVVQELPNGKCALYSPSCDRLTPLPGAFSGTCLAALSADGRYVAAATENPLHLIVLDTMTQGIVTETSLAPTVPSIHGVSVDCDGNVLLTRPEGSFEVPRGTQDASTLPSPCLEDETPYIRFALDGRHVVSVSRHAIELGNKDGSAVLTLPHRSSLRPTSIGFSPGCAMLSVLYEHRPVHVDSIEDGVLAIFDLTGATHGASVSPAVERSVPHSVYLGIGLTWFDPDGGGVRAAYGGPDDDCVVLAHIPLIQSNRT